VVRGAGITATHTTATAIILMVMVVPTVTVAAATATVVAVTVTGTITLTGVTNMVMDTGVITVTVMDTATAADPESPSCKNGCHGQAITMDPSTASWDRKRGEQSGRTSKTTTTQVSRRPSGQPDREAAIIFSVDWPAVS